MVRPLSLIKKLTEAWRLVGHRRSRVSDVISITEVQGTLGNGSYQMEQEAEVLVRALNVKLCIFVHVSVWTCAFVLEYHSWLSPDVMMMSHLKYSSIGQRPSGSVCDALPAPLVSVLDVEFWILSPYWVKMAKMPANSQITTTKTNMKVKTLSK